MNIATLWVLVFITGTGGSVSTQVVVQHYVSEKQCKTVEAALVRTSPNPFFKSSCTLVELR